MDGELSKTEIAEAQLPTLLPGERRDSAVSLDGNTSTGAPKEDIGPRRFYVHVFQSGRFKFEPGFQSPTMCVASFHTYAGRSLMVCQLVEQIRIISP